MMLEKLLDMYDCCWVAVFRPSGGRQRGLSHLNQGKFCEDLLKNRIDEELAVKFLKIIIGSQKADRLGMPPEGYYEPYGEWWTDGSCW